jgi:mRNA interferase RelE/StbE
MRIVFRRPAEKALNGLPAARRRQLLGRIERLASASASRTLDIRRLEGGSGLFRLRVGDYRVLFSIDEAADVRRELAQRAPWRPLVAADPTPTSARRASGTSAHTAPTSLLFDRRLCPIRCSQCFNSLFSRVTNL